MLPSTSGFVDTITVEDDSANLIAPIELEELPGQPTFASLAQPSGVEAAASFVRQSTGKRLDKIDNLLSHYEEDPEFDLLSALTRVEEEQNEAIEDDGFVTLSQQGQHQQPTGAFAQEYVFDDYAKERMERREKLMRTKISELREQVKGLTEANKKLVMEKRELDIGLGEEKEKLERLELRSYINTVSTINRDAVNAAEEEAKRKAAEEARKRAKREAARRAALESGIMLEETLDDDYAVDSTQQLTLKRRAKKKLNEFVMSTLPLESDLIRVEAQFGAGIASFYRLFRWIFYQTVIISIIVVLFTIWHLLDTSTEQWTTIDQYLPVAILYSSFNDALLYTLMILVVFVILTLFTVQRIVWEDKKARTQDVEISATDNRFAKAAFCCWDFGLAEKTRISDYRLQVCEEFLVLLTESRDQKSTLQRTRTESILLWSRRILGFLIAAGLLAGAWALIIFLTFQEYSIQQDLSGTFLDSLATFIVPLVVSITSVLMVPLIKLLTHFENWDSPRFSLKFEVSRIFALKILNVGLVLFTYFQLLSGVYILEGTADALSPGECVENRVGIGLFTLFVVDFFLKKFVNIGMLAAKALYYRLKQGEGGKIVTPKSEFHLASASVDLIYQQTLLLMLSVYMPFGVVVGSLLHYLSFKWMVFWMKFNLRPKTAWRARDIGSFFLIFYGIVFTLSLAGLFFFMSEAHINCGPFIGARTVMLYISQFQTMPYMNIVIFVFTSPAVLWSVIVIAWILWYLKRNKLVAFQTFYINKDMSIRREIDSMTTLIKKLQRQIVQYKRLREVAIDMDVNVEDQDDL